MGAYQEVNKTYTAQQSKQESKSQEAPKIYKIHIALPSAMESSTNTEKRRFSGQMNCMQVIQEPRDKASVGCPQWWTGL